MRGGRPVGGSCSGAVSKPSRLEVEVTLAVALKVEVVEVAVARATDDTAPALLRWRVWIKTHADNSERKQEAQREST
jgi:hypothetical protein